MLGGNDGTETPPPTVSTAGTAPELLPRRTAGPRKNRRTDGAVLTKDRCFRGKYGARAEKRLIQAVRPPAGAGRAGATPPLPPVRRAAFPGKRRTAARCPPIRSAAEKMTCPLAKSDGFCYTILKCAGLRSVCAASFWNGRRFLCRRKISWCSPWPRHCACWT